MSLAYIKVVICLEQKIIANLENCITIITFMQKIFVPISFQNL